MMEKYLKKVYLSADVYAICIQHALTTEKQEIMGLLMGNIDEDECISHISACMILHRSDKQPDRVEISPEQLCHASIHAEKLSQKLGKQMRVVGWYHSHPHITVWPSHVDTRTQATYQTMDPLFVGLIFSVYRNDSINRPNSLQFICFQACKGLSDEWERREIPVIIKNSGVEEHNLQNIINLPKILVQEEIDMYELRAKDEGDELANLHNNAIKTQALAHIIAKVGRPLCDDLEQRLAALNTRIKELERLKLSYIN